MTEINSLLQSGYNLLSNGQEIAFSRYIRLVLPVDGFVFWVKKSLIGAVNINGLPLNSFPLNSFEQTSDPANEFTVNGSLHHATTNMQENSQVRAQNNMIFTTSTKVDDLNDLGENELLIGSYNDIQFAFNARGSFYEQAGLFHYTGESINPIMRSQIIDDLSFFDDSKIVNDSLPILMSLSVFAPVYPAFRGLQNARPPFISVDVLETTALEQLPAEDGMQNRKQWCMDTVKLTLYGFNNNKTQDYIWYLVHEGLKATDFGISNAPIAKKLDIPQSELNVTANAKTIELNINYYQDRAINIAKQLILEAFCSVQVNEFPLS